MTEYKIDENKVRSGLLFVGKLDVWANEMMADKIAKVVMPAVVKSFPNEVLSIVGAYPSKEIMNLSSKNIKIYPNVPSVADFYSNNMIFLHPHVGASGIQNKLLEAMASGMAVVTTETGNQGINGIHREHLLISKDIEDFKNLTLELLTNPDLVKKLGENARKFIIETHSWQSVFNDIDKIIERHAN